MLRENYELKPSESDVAGHLSNLVEGARRATSSPNSLMAYETWRAFLAWAAALNIDPRSLPFPEALEIINF